MKNALITGITGQDGSILLRLLEKGYQVYGIMRRKSVVDYGNVEHIKDKINFIYADMTDVISLINAMKISQADEVYNLAAQSFVATSWEQPLATADIDALGVTNMLEAIRKVKPTDRFYQASTSEMLVCTGDPQKRPPHSIQEVHMAWQNYTDTGLPRTIEKALAYMPAAVSYSIMKVSAVVKNSLPARLRMLLLRSN